MKVTAETITDAQIRDLRDALLAGDTRTILGADYRECGIALGLVWALSPAYPTSPTRIAQARARCAAIWNAKQGSAK